MMKSFNFVTAFPYMAARVIESIDYIDRHLYIFNQIGLLPDCNLTSGDLKRKMQTIFQYPKRWKFTGVTRSDILQNNELAKKAIETLGKISQQILK